MLDVSQFAKLSQHQTFLLYSIATMCCFTCDMAKVIMYYLEVTLHWEVYIDVFKLTQDISQSTIVAVQNKLKSTVSPNEVVTT